MRAGALLRAAAVLAALGCAPAAFAEGRCAQVSAPPPPAAADRLSASPEGDACVITVEHRRGIGSARIVVDADALVLRFQGFGELESLRVSFSTGALLCELERREAAAAERRCRMDGGDAPGLRQTAEGFEMRLPAVPGPSGEPIELHWVDRWR